MHLSRKFIFYISFLSICAVTACTPQKKLVKNHKEYSRQEILTVLVSHNIDVKWFAAKGDIDLDSKDQKISGTFDLRLRGDSMMMISARKLGVEGARIQISPTDYTILYRLEAMYETAPITSLRQFTGFDVAFDDIQAMALGNIILPDTITSVIEHGADIYKISNVGKDISTTYWINRADMRISKVEYNDANNQQISIELSIYKSVNGFSIAHSRNIKARTPQGLSNIIIEIERIEIDIPKKMNFNIPAHYEKI